MTRVWGGIWKGSTGVPDPTQSNHNVKLLDFTMSSDDQVKSGASGASAALLNQPIVMDVGTATTKAGFAGGSKPKVSKRSLLPKPFPMLPIALSCVRAQGRRNIMCFLKIDFDWTDSFDKCKVLWKWHPG